MPSRPPIVRDIITIRLPNHVPSGREQESDIDIKTGKIQIRPALIVGLPDKVEQPRYPDELIIIAPLTSDKSHYNWATNSPLLYPKLSAGTANLTKTSIVLIDQIRAIDIRRVERRVGTLSKSQYQPIFNSIQIMLTP